MPTLRVKETRMASFNEIWEQLFTAQPRRPQVAVKERLIRSPSYVNNYIEWKSSQQPRALIREVEKAYYYKRNQIQGFYQVHLLQSAPANGFALSYHPHIGEESFRFLFDYWRDAMLALGYRLKNTDRHMREMPAYVQTTEKHYLKPPLRRQQLPLNQLYGNVLLEHVQLNGKPSYLKVQANIYADHSYTEALPFDELASRLFAVE